MIVISGALVLMAAILLFIGLLAGSSLTAIYVSIGLSIVAAVFLWLGINQRPVEVPAQAGVRGAGDRGDRGRRQRDDEGDSERSSQHRRPAAKPVTKERAEEPERPSEVTQQIDVMSDDLVEDSDERTVAAAVATGADVFVVSGHPRYHLEECPAVTGNDEAESLPIGEARELGFVPCGACRPDSEIAEATALPHTSNGSSAPEAAPSATSPAGEPELVNAPPAVAASAQPSAPTPPPAVAPPPGTDVPSTAPSAPQMPAADVPAVAPPPATAAPAAYQQQPSPPQPEQWQQPAPPQPAQWQQPVQPPAPAVADQPPAGYQAPPQPPVSYGAPAQQPPAESQAPPQLPVAGQPPAAQQPTAAQPAVAPEQVVVLPGKARFHRPGCRLVSGPDATESLDKADAVRQGYLACAICKP